MNQPNEKRVDLKIDFREQRSGIVEEIKKLTDKFNPPLPQVPVPFLCPAYI